MSRAASVKGGDAASATGTRPPNIVYIMADQMAAPILPLHDPSSVIKMPHLMSLVDDGATVFDQAYTNSPLCAPSRFTMCSGQLPSKIGAYDNAAHFASDIPCYAHYLRQAGYHTALSGKMHFIGQDQLHGFEERLTSDIYPADYGWTVDWQSPDVRVDWYHNMSSVEEAGPSYRTNQIDFDEEVTYKAMQYIYDRKRRFAGQPFMLTMALTHPHDPYNALKPFWDQYEDVEIPLPKHQIPQEAQDAHSRRLLKVIDLWDKPLTPEQIKRARRAYFANCTYVDDKIGQILRVLKECDLMENTILVFSGDHGDHLGERGLWYKMSYYEMSARIPLVVYAPHLYNVRRVTVPVSGIDLMPTFVEMAGATLHPQLPIDGQSLLPLLEGKEPPANAELVAVDGSAKERTVYGEYMGEGTISPLFMIRRGPYKYLFCASDPPQLFNVEKDPEEKENLNLTHSAASDFEREVMQKWDIGQITRDVLQSQMRRRMLAEALKKGRVTVWDHQPLVDAGKQYIRNTEILDNLEHIARIDAPDQ